MAAQAAAYEQARALIREAQASLFPTLNAILQRHAGLQRAGYGRAPARSRPPRGGGTYSTTFVPGLSGTWDLDVWGKVRRQIESNASAAQASAADLDNVKLSAAGRCSPPPISICARRIRCIDLLDRTIVQYKKTLDIVQNQFKAGYSVTPRDVATAQAQVDNAEAQANRASACSARNMSTPSPC